jgi:hypothetical protein
MTTNLKMTTGLMLLTTLATLLAQPVLAAGPSVVRELGYAAASDNHFDCSAACSSSVQQKIIKVKYTPCPPGQVGGYFEVSITVTATVYVNGNPVATVTISVTLYKTGACVGVSSLCTQDAPQFATNEFDFANNVRTVRATGLLVSPDGSLMPHAGQFSLEGLDESGASLGTFHFNCPVTTGVTAN